MRVRSVDPRKVYVPDVRMTSMMDADEYAELRESIRAQGILVPLRVTLAGERLVLVDGLNRLRAATDLHLDRVPVIVDEGELDANLVQNVITNRMRGRQAPGELVGVVKALQADFGLSPDEIEERIGLSRGYLRALLRVAEASPELLEAVGRREIALGAAIEIARVPGFDNQGTLLSIVRQGRFTVDDTRRAADVMIANLAAPPLERKTVDELPLGKALCTVCDAWKDPGDFEAPVVCRACWGALLTVYGSTIAARSAPGDRPASS